jgi:hypothetical protein
MLLGYTWSHTLDVSSDSNNGGTVQDPYNWKGSYGNSNWDIRHRFVASYFYELPFFKTAKPWQRYLLGGWQINGVTTIQSGTPSLPHRERSANTGSQVELTRSHAPAVANCGGGRLVLLHTASFAIPVPSIMATLDATSTGRDWVRRTLAFEPSAGRRAGAQLEEANANKPSFSN